MILFLSRMICSLPLLSVLAVGRAFGLVWYYLFPVRRAEALRNIRRVFGETLSPREQRRLLRRSLCHWGMYGIESLRLPLLTPELSHELIEVRGLEYLDAAGARGKGVIGVTAHMGSFDLLACGLAVRGINFAVIFKDIRWKPAHDFWFAIRRRTGIKVIAPRRSKDEIRAALSRNEKIGFVIDQHMARHRAIVCDFFGHLASTSPAAVRFAFETGAAIVPLYIRRADECGKHIITFEPILELEMPHPDVASNIRHNTERLNRRVEDWVTSAPEQWLWLHRRWKVHEHPEGWDIPSDLARRYRNGTCALAREPAEAGHESRARQQAG